MTAHGIPDLDLPVFPPGMEPPGPPVLSPEQYLQWLEDARKLMPSEAFEAWLNDPNSLPRGEPFEM